MSQQTSSPQAENPPSGVVADAARRILDTAERLFATLGYDAVSMSMIADQAHVSKANIFHHFISKEALYLTVLKSACAESARLLEHLASGDGIGERLAQFATAHLEHLNKHRDVTRLVQRELFEDGARRGKELAEQACGENFARLVEILRDGQARGELRAALDPALIATLLVGANVFFFQAHDMLRHFPSVDFADDPARFSRAAVELILRGALPAAREQTDKNG
ncbi:MAG: TetR/AcrR family transcriptional regulator [Pseudomonadota bacterium]